MSECKALTFRERATPRMVYYYLEQNAHEKVELGAVHNALEF